VRIAAVEATLTTAHGRLGLPCPFGLAWLLPRLIGLAPALDLILTSRKVSGAEALAMGLVHQVFPGQELTAGVDDYARRLATTVSPASLAASKRQVYDAMHQSVGEAVRATEALLDPMMAGGDYREGVAALREKRPPHFGDLPYGGGRPA
jgi:enoyl-CoA hydratase/carnithine racemase